MKKALLISCLLTIFITTIGQNVVTDTSVTCVAYWKKGDKKDISVTITTQVSDKGIETRKLTDTYKATMRIIESTEKNYTIEWINTSKSDDLNNFSFDALSSLFTGITVIYKTDELGSFETLVNYTEVQQHLNNSFNDLKKRSSGNSELDSIIQKLKSIFQSKESIEQLVLRDIALFHAAFGGEFAFGKNQQYETELPNFLGGEPFPALLTLYLLKKDTKADIATIAVDQELDEKRGGQLIKEIIKKLLPPGTVIDDDKLPAYLTMTDHNEFDIIISTGWLKRAHLKRVSKTGDFQKVQTFEIIVK